jgi:hypothetical protein
MEFLSKNKKHAKRAGRPIFKPTRRTREQVEIAIAGACQRLKLRVRSVFPGAHSRYISQMS